MRRSPMPGRAAAGALALACALATQPALAAPAATPKPTPAPCPGTTLAAPPTPSPAATTTGTASSTPTPAAVPPPVIPKRDVVVGGDRLGTNTLVADLPAGTPAPPVLNATSWVLADAASGDVIAAKAPHALLRPASTIKALTALALLPRLDPKRVVVAAASDMGADGTKVGIVEKNRYTVDQLFHAMLMASANDAVYALTRAIPGGRSATLGHANSLAHELGALDTVVKDPSGLDADGQVSSAYDLALIGREALQDKRFRKYSTTRQFVFPGAVQPGRAPVAPYSIQNHNKMLYNYAGSIGVKNGYTSLAHGTFITAATRGGRTYVLTYMCADGIGWREMAATLDWAFAHGAKARPVGELVEPGTLDATPAATQGSTALLVPATPSASSSSAGPDSAEAASATSGRSREFAEKWWGAAVLGLALAALGVLGSRRIGRRG